MHARSFRLAGLPQPHYSAALALLLAIAGPGCGDKRRASDTGSAATTSATSPATAVTAARAPTTPPLAIDGPVFDLAANELLVHTYDRDGALVVPVASEALRKYVTEYKNPWGAVVRVDAHPGRALTSRSARLQLPWLASGEATLRLRVHGVAAGQRVSVFVNGTNVANESLQADWQVATIALGTLAAGEVELRLTFGKRGSAGDTSAYALVHSLDVAPGAPQATDASEYPPLSPVAEVEGVPALTGFASYAMYLEAPPDAFLTLRTRGSGGFAVRARPAVGEAVTLLEAEQSSGDTERRISLAPIAGELVRLELTAPAPIAALLEPTIALVEVDERPAPPPVENAILWVGDALRSDKLALYGETRVQTPRITALGKQRGIAFLNNQAASPSSPPSHASIQTGMIPRVHGIVGDSSKVAAGTPLLSSQLEAAGVKTAYVGNNPFGMARLEEPGNWTWFRQPGREGKSHDCSVMVELMLEFAKTQHDAGKRFFISSLAYEPHTPYRFHEGITEKYFAGPYPPPIGTSASTVLDDINAGRLKPTPEQWKQLIALHDGEIEYMDGCVGSLLDGLEEMGVLENTAFILTSDHGEGFWEHQHLGHAWGHNAEVANVPLVIVSPGLTSEGRTIDTVTSHLDITPTILALMGVEPAPQIQGQSLLPLIARNGPWTPRVVPLEYGRSFSLRARDWRYITDYAGGETLFHLAEDPGEQRELGAERPIALRYFRDLTGVFLAHRQDWRMASWGPLNNHQSAFLEHLGIR